MKNSTYQAAVALAAVILATGLFAATARAENEGLKDLDKATEAKLDAETVKELSEVIELLESAMKKGLDDDNRKFAEQLLAATLIGRAEIVAEAIFDNPRQAGARLPQFVGLAIADLERALALNDNQPEAHLTLARLYAASGKKEQAIKSLGQVIDAEKVSLEKRVKALLMRGTLHSEEKQRLADFDKAVEIAPDNAEAISNRAVFLLSLGKTDQAIEDFTKAIEKNPDKAGLYLLRGQALAAQEKLDEALADFDKAVELEPKSATGYAQRARLYAAQNKLDKAIENLDRAIQFKSTAPSLLMLRAGVLAQQGKIDKALADADAAANFPQAHLQARRLKADLLASSDRLEEGIEQLEQLLERFPTNAEIAQQLARYYLVADNPRKAIEHFTAVIEANPAAWQSLRGRGDAYLSIGKQKAAIEDYKAGLKLAEEDDGLLNNLAWVLATSPDEDLRDGELAVKLAKKASEVTDYKEGHILSTLAAAYAETGDFEKARKWSKKAVEIGRESQKEQLQAELESYQNNKPWRELQQTGDEDPGQKQEPAGPPARTLDF